MAKEKKNSKTMENQFMSQEIKKDGKELHKHHKSMAAHHKKEHAHHMKKLEKVASGFSKGMTDTKKA
jgi:hypothetical protein